MRKIIAVLLLVTLPCVSYAYNDWYKSVLKSVFSAKETSIVVSINTRFFDLLKKGETLEEYMRHSTLMGAGDEVDKSFAYGGRVQNNLNSLVSDKLQKRFSIKTVDWRVAPYQTKVDVSVRQGLDIYGDNTFEVLLDIDFQEAAITRTGKTGFISVYHFHGQTFAGSKGEAESQVYAALDKAIDAMQKVISQADEYCAGGACK